MMNLRNITLIKKIRKFKYSRYVKKQLEYDVNKYLNQYTTPLSLEKNKTTLEREIMVLSHTLEKGLSHKKIKPLFGYKVMTQLCEYIKEYSQTTGLDEYILSLGVSIWMEYNKVNSNLNDKLFEIPEHLKKYCNSEVGAFETSKDNYFKYINSNFESFSNSRRSVRLFDTKSDEIPLELIKKAIGLAINAPSACNRQAVRVQIITDKELINKISSIQGGNRGFGENSGALLIIKSNLNYYYPNERRIPMFDCGLFTMNLLYALHFYQLGACVLNGSLSEEQEIDLKNVVNINDNEIIASILSVVNIPDDETIKIACSFRRKPDDIIDIN